MILHNKNYIILFHCKSFVDIFSFFYGHPNIFTDIYGQVILNLLFTDSWQPWGMDPCWHWYIFEAKPSFTIES